jgi:hypothetical protein
VKRRAAVLANRALGFAHRQVGRIDRLMPELALTFFGDAEVERDGLLSNYGARTAYVSEANQALGLYPFEARAIEAYFPKPPAKILLPGAGAGREAFALRSAGYEVDAFDASPALVDAACARGGAGAVRLSELERWIDEGTENGQPFDAIFTGWALWTHLVHRKDRLAALAGFRRVCPKGPVLLSFWRREKVFDLEETGIDKGASSRLQRLLQRARTLVKRDIEAEGEEGTVWRGGMFAHLVSEHEIVEECDGAGYRVAHYERDGSRFPNAVLIPRP